jgi:hypothetical protein
VEVDEGADVDEGDRTRDDGAGARDRDEDDQSGGEEEAEDEDGDREKISPELLTRILHAFFEREGTRITRDANAAVARYVDDFVREAIARAAVERERGFLEVSFFFFFFLFGGGFVGLGWLLTLGRLRTWRRLRRSC